jgi:hypothetical protein
MSTRYVPTTICDGCGTVIETDYHLKIKPHGQKVLQPTAISSAWRDFCCEACEEWWHAQFPAEGPWGPAWDERDWWCENVGPCAERAHVRTAHEEMPLIDTKVHFKDPEQI